MISLSNILNGKVLIVDDQQANIILLKQILSGAGYVSITSTNNSYDVCALHSKNSYDLILLDLQMPGMDGFQVMDALKEIEPNGYIPVLAITAHPDHKLRALQAGAKDFISTPFDLADILVRVHNMLEVRLLHKKLNNYNAVLEQQVREQTKLLAISHTLASTLELQPGLILDQLHEIVDYTQGGLFALKDASLETLAMRGTDQLKNSPPVQIRLNTPETLTTLFNRHQPIRISDVWGDNPQAQFLRSILDDKARILIEGMRSWMWVPLAVKGRVIGGVGVAEITENYFTDHHAGLALSVADQSAITMVNANLYEQAQALAVVEERQRLARDLHDAVNQSIFSAGIIAEVLPRLWERDQEEARRSLEDLRRLTRGAMAEMRALLAELRPSTLTDSYLGDLLHMLGNALSGRINIPVTVNVSGDVMLPAEAQLAFYRLCQESLSNVAKHAKASQVEIALWQNGTSVEMSIRDNGQGFNTEQKFSGHYGLSMMRERAEAAGVLLSVKSQPGHGTESLVCWAQKPIEDSLI